MTFRSVVFLLLTAGLCLCVQVSSQPFPTEKIAVGAIFDQNSEEIQNVFKYAMTQQNQNITNRGRLELQAYVDIINTADAFKLSRLICNQFARGVWSMLGAVTPDSFDTLHSYTNTFQMPFVTPWFPEKVIPPSSGLIDHAISMRPDYHKAIIDTIMYYEWKDIIFIYDSHDGLLRLQQLYQIMQPGRTTFKISLVKRINNASDALEFLLALEQQDRWGNKRIVLDCSAKNAKSILVGHVQNVQLGRRTYHYILSGLVMDDHWENEVTEYGAVNITGFRMIDHSRKIVRDFMDGLRKMDPKAKDTISTQAALMYDGVQVLIDALGRLWKKKPDAFRNALRRAVGQINSTKVIDCNPGKSWVTPFEHGDKISRLIKKSDIEGLTGNISFNDEGHRHNFTLHVVEMTVQSAMIKIATWSDKNGLMPKHSNKLVPLRSPNSFDTNKTYVVTTVLQEPYMMKRSLEPGEIANDQFYGFCKDLTDTLAQELGIKYEIRVAKNTNYGNENVQQAWSGVIGDLIKKDADIAVAPLAITSERQKVIDFTESYMSLEYADKSGKINKHLSYTFSFLRPLSKEIWVCVLLSFFAVSIVLFLVSRFSPHEWRSVAVSDTNLDNPISRTNEIILHNEFSIWNSFWFSLGSFMQQGSDVVPRSLSGRIVSTVWWFFALILVCSYTANLAAYLIIERITEPNNNFVQYHLQHTEEYQGIVSENVLNLRDKEKDENLLSQFKMDEQGRVTCNNLQNTCTKRQIHLALATAKGSALRESINILLVKLKSNGVMTKLLQKWILRSDQQDCQLQKNEHNIPEITLSQVSGVFYVLVGGLIVALGVALLDFFNQRRNETTRANVTLRSALKTKSKMATRNDIKNPHRTPLRDIERLGWNGAPFPGYNSGMNQTPHEDGAVHAGFTHV